MRSLKIGDTIYLKNRRKHRYELLNWSKRDGLLTGKKLKVIDVVGEWVRVIPSDKQLLHNPQKFSFSKPKNKKSCYN